MGKASIFVSYRQADARAWAVALRDELALAFGEDEVFLDADSLHAGRWSEQIAAALDGCKLLLLVIGSSWLTSRGPDGRCRLDDPQDVHRREIEHALQRPGVLVLPILVDGAAMPAQDKLPASLQGLAAQQAMVWSRRADHRALDRSRLCAAVAGHTGLAQRRPRPRWRWQALAAPLAGGIVGMLLLGVGFSMAAMPLSAVEMAVVFVLGATVAALLLVIWSRWRRTARQA